MFNATINPAPPAPNVVDLPVGTFFRVASWVDATLMRTGNPTSSVRVDDGSFALLATDQYEATAQVLGRLVISEA